MPSISDKIQHLSLQHLCIYKEGAFCVAYEQSAYFVTQYKGYKPTKKYYKNIKQSVVSVGFPNVERLIDELTKNDCIGEVDKAGTSVKMILKENINYTDFELWKNGLSENKALKSKASIEEQVKAFPLAHKTPMEAFLFLKEIQELV